jgi:hypothetical protein
MTTESMRVWQVVDAGPRVIEDLRMVDVWDSLIQDADLYEDWETAVMECEKRMRALRVEAGLIGPWDVDDRGTEITWTYPVGARSGELEHVVIAREIQVARRHRESGGG